MKLYSNIIIYEIHIYKIGFIWILQNKLFLVLTLSLVLGVFSASEVFAEIDYDEIKIESISTVLFERSDVNIIVATVQLSNNSDEKFPSSGNYFYLVSSVPN